MSGVHPLLHSPWALGTAKYYAIAKFVALQEAGVSAVDLRIVILRDDILEEDHAVVAARLDGNWLMLDNRHMVMPEDNQVRKYYRPIFLIDHNGVRRYSSSSSTSEKSGAHERLVGPLLH